MERKFNQWIQLLRCTELSGNERIVLALILNYHNNEKTFLHHNAWSVSCYIHHGNNILQQR